MKLYLELVPVNSSRLPRWVEQHLVSDHLGELIEELLAIRPPPAALDFDAWFHPFKDQILSAGLSRVPRPALRQLLAYPPALRQLQKAVLLGGGRYWDEVPRSKGFRRRLATSRTAPSQPAPLSGTPPPPQLRLSPAAGPLPLAAPTGAVARRGVPVWAIVMAVVATVAVSGLVVWLVLTTTTPAN